MPGAGHLAKMAVKYGVKYGPIFYEAVKHGREPAQRAAQAALERQTLRRRAFQHAASVVDGSVLRMFHRTEPVWVVFSGPEPIASYPADVAPLTELVRHADLDRRTRPGGGPRLPGFVRRALGRGDGPDASGSVAGSEQSGDGSSPG